MEKVWLKRYPEKVPAEIDFGSYNSLNDIFDESVQKACFKSRLCKHGMHNDLC